MVAEALLHKERHVNSSNCLLNSEFALNCQQKQQKTINSLEKRGRRRNWSRHRPPLLSAPPSTTVGHSRGHVGLALLAAGVSPVQVETHLVSYLLIFSTDDTIYNQYSEAHSVVHRTPLCVPVMLSMVTTRWNIQKWPSKEHILDMSSFLTAE